MFSVRNKHKKKIIAEINITPFVDVVLVILVVFMVTAPMLSNSFNINLPKSSNKSSVSKSKKELIIYIDKANNLFLDDRVIEKNKLSNTLVNYDENNTTVFIQADKSVVYQSIIDVMSELYALGFVNISLVTTK